MTMFDRMAMLRTRFGSLSRSAAVVQAGWVTGIFVIVQVLRLGSNVVLAHLLAPAIFGVMALVNSLRTGVELLTDVGISQNIVVSKRGDEADFYNTAWTLQLVRGLMLTIIGAAAAWPLARLYGKPELYAILLVCSAIFLLTALQTPARYLMQRRREARKLTILDAAFQVIGMAVSIAFAWAMPTVWGMTWAIVVSTALTSAISFALMDFRKLRLILADEHVAAMLRFGKWIFISSLIYFAASNFDRLYLPAHIPLALFGVYGISRSMSDLAIQLMQKLGGMVIFPGVARESGALYQRMARIRTLRRMGLALVSIGIGGGVAISDVFVHLAYDHRYATATVLLPMLLIGSWFSVQAAISESVLLGLSQPSRTAGANLAKFLWTLALLPFVFGRHDYLLVFAVIAAADVPRYLILLIAQRRAGLHFVLQDVEQFALMAISAATVRLVLVSAGFADGFVTAAQWSILGTLAGGGA